MITFLTSHLWAVWLILAFILLILELSSGDFVFTCFALGAFGAALSCVCDSPIWVQLCAFVIFSLLSLQFIRPPLVRWLHSKEKERQSNADALIGRVGRVIETIEGDGYGYLQVDGDQWKAESISGVTIEKGKKAQIVERESIIVKVKEI